MSRNRLSIATVIALAFVLGFLITVWTRNVSAQQRTAALSVGRYVMAPPPAGDNAYASFLWVLDTQTGDVRGYNFATTANDRGEVTGWFVLPLRTALDPTRK